MESGSVTGSPGLDRFAATPPSHIKTGLRRLKEAEEKGWRCTRTDLMECQLEHSLVNSGHPSFREPNHVGPRIRVERAGACGVLGAGDVRDQLRMENLHQVQSPLARGRVT